MESKSAQEETSKNVQIPFIKNHPQISLSKSPPNVSKTLITIYWYISLSTESTQNLTKPNCFSISQRSSKNPFFNIFKSFPKPQCFSISERSTKIAFFYFFKNLPMPHCFSMAEISTTIKFFYIFENFRKRSSKAEPQTN